MAQPRATRVIQRPDLPPGMLSDHVVLDHADRRRRRLALTGEAGTGFLLDLERAAALEDGDVLALDDGRLIGVKAAAQRLYEVRAVDPHDLARIAWHIGNRHTPAEIDAATIYIEEDHVLAEMLQGLGCRVTPVLRPFRPERGAYAGQGHSHAPGHQHDH